MQTPDEKTLKTGAFVYPHFRVPYSCGPRAAIAWLRQFAIGPSRSVCAGTRKAVIAGGHRGIGLSQNELAFPAQRGAQVRMIGIETFHSLIMGHLQRRPSKWRALQLLSQASLFNVWLSGLACSGRCRRLFGPFSSLPLAHYACCASGKAKHRRNVT